MTLCNGQISLILLGLATTSSSISLRSSVPAFSFKNSCFVCGDLVEDVNVANVSRVESNQLANNILKHCKTRVGAFSESVQMRILSVHDLKAAGAMYHRTCLQMLYSNKRCPPESESTEELSTKVKIGRKVEPDTAIAFEKVAKYTYPNPNCIPKC